MSQKLKGVFRHIPRILASVGISLAALWLAARNVNWNELKSLLREARLSYIYLGFLVSFVSLWLRARRWKLMLEPFQTISAWALLRWQIGGILVNNFLPLRIGELARTYWASHKSSIPRTTILATIVMERVFDVGTVAAITLILLAVMKLPAGHSLIPPQTLAYSALAGLAMVLIGKSILKRKSSDEIVMSLKPRLPEKAGVLLEHFIAGLHVLKDKKEIAKLSVLSPVIWSVDIAVLALASRSLGLDLSWTQAGLTTGGLILGVMIPAAPGAVGTFEAGGVHALALMGFNSTLAFSFVALLHAFQMIFTLALGLPALMFEGFNPRKLYEEIETGVRSRPDPHDPKVPGSGLDLTP